MKRSQLWILTALLFVSCGGGDDGAGPGGNNDTRKPTPTPAGVPNGDPTTQTIGASGGTVTSSDGLFSIYVPPGALPGAAAATAIETDITIQPITNTAWGGIGPAYRLLPDGLTFAEPVEVNFLLADTLLTGTDSVFVHIARQSGDGAWGILKHRRLDWETRTLTCTTSHLSDYSLIGGVQILPASARLAVNQSRELRVRMCLPVFISDDDDYVDWWIARCDDWLWGVNAIKNWSVNGVVGGNSTVGSVAPTTDTPVTYTAPAVPPVANPVAVSVRITQSYWGSSLLVSNITITSSAFTGTILQFGADNGYDAPDSTLWDMSWTSDGTIGTFEKLTGTGSVAYTMVDQLDCPSESMTPNTGLVDPAQSYIYIDHSMNPPAVLVVTGAEWNVRECYQCLTDPEYCVDYRFIAAFGDDQATVSADGDTISGHFQDQGSKAGWTYRFVRMKP